MRNPVTYFEIPVSDIDRAINCYSSVFGSNFEVSYLDGYKMAFFESFPDMPGITGALVYGDIYKPSLEGPVLYFNVGDIDMTIEKIVKSGYQILYPRKDNGEYGLVAEFKDSEGNRIGLYQKTSK